MLGVQSYQDDAFYPYRTTYCTKCKSYVERYIFSNDFICEECEDDNQL